MTKRLIVRGLMLLICALAALWLFAGSAFADGGITTWAELQAAFNAGGTVTLTQDIAASASNGDMGLNIPAGVSVTLNLGGHTLNTADALMDADDSENYAEGIIRVRGTLTLEGSGTITVSSNTDSDGIYIDGGTFIMNGGTISGCYIGVDVDGGIFTMNGGTISGCGFDGVYLYAASSTMNGGSITDSASYGVAVNFSHFVLNDGYITDNADGGVFMTGFNYSTEPSSFTMNGGSVTGGNRGLYMFYGVNFSMNGGFMSCSGEYVIDNLLDGNISLGGGRIEGLISLHESSLSITGQLDENACYQVVLDEPRVFTSGLNGKGTAANFVSGDEDYGVVLNDDGEAMLVDADSIARYVERSWNGTQVVSTDQTHTAAPVPSDGNMTSGWYYLNSDVTVNGRIESITGDVHLILGDGFTLNVKGLYVPQGSTLAIYGQTAGTGKIYSHPSGGAAIGGYSGHDNGNIVIHGGTIEANAYDHCAGIGSNDGKTGGAITIYGGTITAEGGSDGAGIGGGRNCDGGTITIYGGDITAKGGGENGAGIGGGDSAAGGTIVIWGGTINANEDPNEDGAGIGGGDAGEGGSITIHGGTVNCWSRDGAGIGGGDNGDGGTITIHGGTITSTKVNQGQGARIGGGCDGAPGTITIHGGSITTVGGKGAGIGGGKGNTAGGSVTIDGGVINASGSYGIGSGDDGADVAITLGHTDATMETISITASSYGGTVTAEKPFKSDTVLVYPGTVADVSALSGSTLLGWDEKITSWRMLEMAVESAKNGAVLTLGGDCTATADDACLDTQKNLTIDLNGHTLDGTALTTDNVIRVSGKGKVKVRDSGSGGTVLGSGGSSVIEATGFDATFILESGTICGTDCTQAVYAYMGYFTMTGGTVTASGQNCEQVVTMDKSCLVLTGGTIRAENEDDVAVLFVTPSSSLYMAWSPEIRGNVVLTKRIYFYNLIGPDVRISVLPTDDLLRHFGNVLTYELPEYGSIDNFVSGDPENYALGLNDDGEAYISDQPVTVSFAPGYETSETMESVRWAKDGWYPLPACGFSGPAGYVFAAWQIGEAMEIGNEGDLINVSDGITLTAVWQFVPFGTPDFVIPDDVSVIENNAFENIAATVVEIPENCTSIGNEAFMNCTHLTMIRIPAGCQLGSRVFDGCTKVYVFGAVGSDAQRYCNENANCVFVEDAQE